jgi:glycerol-3-phosphate acyltransferase PlsX
MPSVIALDAMGSDRAPRPEIEGAIQAARHYPVRVLLVGPESTIKAELDRHPSASRLPLEIVHASEHITMEDKVDAIRAKRDSSMRVGLRLVREGQASGFVTAGNTGAAMATAKVVLGAVPGVDRPALAAVFPTAPGTAAMLLDVGANVDCTAQNLQQFAVMGEIYFRSMFPAGRRPRVGLLSIGEEETKGNDLTRESFQLLKNLPLNFIGNVEGRDLYNGHADVIVADGFVGNVALKISEGVANLVRTALKESLKATITRQVGALLSRSAFTDFKKRLDHTEYGGAPLLGLKGVCIITHGSSNANAIKNAVRVAAEFADRGINESIERGLAALRPAQDAAEAAAPAALAPSGS